MKPSDQPPTGNSVQPIQPTPTGDTTIIVQRQAFPAMITKPTVVCSHCGLPCIGGNSVRDFESRFFAAQQIGTKDKHILPVIRDGVMVCPGSPSRGQYLIGQPKDLRPGFEYGPQHENEMRNAYHFSRYHCGRQVPVVEYENGFVRPCPMCFRPTQYPAPVSSVPEGWIVPLTCENCSKADAPQVVLIPFSDKAPIQLVSAEDFACMGGIGMIQASAT